MIKVFNKEEVKVDDYNLIVSNLILSQKYNFSYDSLMSKLKEMFGDVNKDLESALSKALIRLRDDGFISVLGSTYRVVKLDI